MTQPTTPGKHRLPLPLKWVAALLAVAGLALLGTWIGQRTLRSPGRKRAAQIWLDRNLNTDVAILGDMSVRLNLLRSSRLAFTDIEIEHPNAIFSGKLLNAALFEARVTPWALAGLWPDRLNLSLRRFAIEVEQDETGEWSTDGLAVPFAIDTETAVFPFPAPAISSWLLKLSEGALVVRRHDLEMRAEISGEASGAPETGRFVLKLDKARIEFGQPDAPEERPTGLIGPLSAVFSRSAGGGAEYFPPVLERCDFPVEDLPLSILPFLFAGLPMKNAAGLFNGGFMIDRKDGNAAGLAIEGELRNTPLTAFGLPHRAPLRMEWTSAADRDGAGVNIHLGPQGFGAFDISMPLNNSGRPTGLSLRGDVAVLDTLAELFSRHPAWSEWLTLTFPSVEWLSSGWHGFGWSGADMRLSLTRSAAGIRLAGDLGFAGGRAAIEMVPDNPDMPIVVVSEKADAGLFVKALASRLPEAFLANMASGSLDFTWRGIPDPSGGFDAWGVALVFTAPEIRTAESGAWWGGLTRIAKAISDLFPDWNKDEREGVLRFTTLQSIQPRQISVVADWNRQGELGIEFRAHGPIFGQSAGYLESDGNGGWRGEILFLGESELIREAGRANQTLGHALSMLATGTGIRMTFIAAADGAVEFDFPFLADLEEARKIRISEDGGEGDG
jgi:hypothetical protein